MAQNQRFAFLATGLLAVGLLGQAAPEPVPPGAPSAPGPTAAVLLLRNGMLKQGAFTETPAGYVQRTTVGKETVAKRDVERAFESIDAVYRYRVGQMPPRDPDEHLKLAQWCLTNRMIAQAKEQLQTVVVLSPTNAQAKNMLLKIEASEDRAALPRRDPALQRTGFETNEGTSGEADESKPRRLDPAFLDDARRRMKIPLAPQIGDLPPALALRRADEFARNVHPVLQTYCARCHNEHYQGRFQLSAVKPRHVPGAEALRINLDATLGLVDMDNPDKSELLSSGLVPHGASHNPTKRPIFRGANDPAYLILSTWVHSLTGSKNGGAVQPARFAQEPPAAVGAGEAFAADRGPSTPLPFTPTPPSATAPIVGARPQPPAMPNPATPRPPGQFLPGSGVGVPAYAPPNAEFPVPYMLGGEKPKPPGQVPPPTTVPAPSAPALPPLPTASSAAPEADSTEIPLPKKPSKPLKVDPALLQRALMNRYQPQ